MAEVENGSVNEPSLSPPAENKENGVDVSTHPQSPDTVDERKSPLPDESDRQPIEVQQVEEDSQEQEVDTVEGSAQSQEPTDAVESTESEAVVQPEDDVPPEEPVDAPSAEQETSPDKEDADERQEVASIPPQEEHVPDVRMRSDSRSTTATFATQRSVPVSSAVFIVTALDAIGASREAKKSKELEDAVQKALTNVKQSDREPIDPEVIFRPLYIATKSFSIPLQVTALDCIGKLITYSYFAFPSAQETKAAETEPTAGHPPLIERAIDAICDCFENEATPVEIQQQIIKSLLAAVLNDKIVVHGAGLLKAVRQIYNIFIYSKSSQNQQIAQGSLTQMVSTVFDRVRVRLELKELLLREGDKGQGAASDVVTIETPDAPQSGEEDHTPDAASGLESDQPVVTEPTEKLTLQSFESSKDVTSVNDNAPTMVTRAKLGQAPARHQSGASADDRPYGDATAEDDEDEIYIKDAFLVFRALCKLSHKILTHDQQQDLKSQNMRSKLLSLHLIHYLINNHVAAFTSPLLTIRTSSSSLDAMTLLQAVRPHLCLSLSRNGSSSVPRVFEVCCEIFWLMLKDMRVMMKKELEVFLKEIYLAILEKRNSPAFQKQYFMEILERLADDPRALVEMYLNYDCDRTALENIFQKYVYAPIVSPCISSNVDFTVSLSSYPDTPVYQSRSVPSSNNSIRKTTLRSRPLGANGTGPALCLPPSRLLISPMPSLQTCKMCPPNIS